MCINSKFQETTEKLLFNPISITSLKLFPNIQTQYLYLKDDTMIEAINNYEIWYKVIYDQYLKFKKDNIKCHHIVYTKYNRFKYGDSIPIEVNIIGEFCFCDCCSVQSINLPTKITSVSTGCFSFCSSLTSLNLSSKFILFGNMCFYGCYKLKGKIDVSDECFENSFT